MQICQELELIIFELHQSTKFMLCIVSMIEVHFETFSPIGRFTSLLGVLRRSSHRRYSVKKLFLEIWQNSQENTCARVSFFNKVASLRPATLLKKRLWHRRVPVNFAKFLKIPFFIEHLWWLLLKKRRFMYCIPAHLVHLAVRKSLVSNYLLR